MTHPLQALYTRAVEELNTLLERQEEHFNQEVTLADGQAASYVRASAEISSKLEEVMADGPEAERQAEQLVFAFAEAMIVRFDGFTDETLFTLYSHLGRLEERGIPNAINCSLDHDLTKMVIRAIERGAEHATNSSPSG